MERWEAELLERLLETQERIANTLERFAAPPEPLLAVQGDADEWAAKEKAREDRDERVAGSLERIADALEVANAAMAVQLVVDPVSPGGMRLKDAAMAELRRMSERTNARRPIP